MSNTTRGKRIGCSVIALVVLALPAAGQLEFSRFSSSTVEVKPRIEFEPVRYVFPDPAIRQPFELLRRQWSWDHGMQVRDAGGRIRDGWPTLNLILAFSKLPDAATLLDRVAIEFLPRSGFSGSRQTLRQLRATIESVQPNTAGGTNGHYPWVVHVKFPNGSMAGRSSTSVNLHVSGVTTSPTVSPASTISAAPILTSIPAAPATELRVTSHDHREELPARTHVILSWTFNRQVPGL